MQLFKNERGSVIFETILVALVLVAIGSAFYFANKARTTKNDYSVVVPKSKTSASSLTTVAKAPADPYAGWKTYTSAYQNASFHYPSNWSLKTTANTGSPAANAQNAVLTSPNGYILNYSDAVYGIGGACGQDSPTVNLTAVQQLPNAGGLVPVYLVQSGAAIGLVGDGGTPSIGSTGGCLFYAIIRKVAHDAGAGVEFASNIQFTLGTPDVLPASQAQDFATAKLILESFKFGG